MEGDDSLSWHTICVFPTFMTIVYRGGPYAGQDDYLLPPPERVGATGGHGYYRRTRQRDESGRVVYEWVARVVSKGSQSLAG